jgi:branched-chain amino acid transport system ATP-binding protein|tara:strand:- start:687 stop:1433 length:747 start_codon:yes stop_codon:yes gene_type:complete
MNNILETHNLTCEFGSLKAVNNVNLKIQKQKIRAIIGPNGAGKTTLFNLITGKIRPSSGKVIFKGKEITKMSPFQIVKKGIGRSFQITNIFPRLSVFNNIFIAVLANSNKTFHIFSNLSSFKNEIGKTYDLLKTVELSEKSRSATSSLSHGERRNLELGITLALKPELILLDEPTAGMSIEETQKTVNLIQKISDKTTVLFTEHDMSIVFKIADIITVLHQGKIIADGSPETIQNNHEVQIAYLGEKI